MIKKKENITMCDLKGDYICEFKNLRDAANLIVAMGLSASYTTVKTSISKVVHTEESKTAYGFNWYYNND